MLVIRAAFFLKVARWQHIAAILGLEELNVYRSNVCLILRSNVVNYEIVSVQIEHLLSHTVYRLLLLLLLLLLCVIF